MIFRRVPSVGCGFKQNSSQEILRQIEQPGLHHGVVSERGDMGLAQVIAQVNDTFRHEAATGTKLSMPGMIVATRKVQALPDAVKRTIFEQIHAYDDFDDGDNDFPDEHGRGQFWIGEQMFVWKIDWIADPTGIVIPERERPETFFRVLTIMCAEEE